MAFRGTKPDYGRHRDSTPWLKGMTWSYRPNGFDGRLVSLRVTTRRLDIAVIPRLTAHHRKAGHYDQLLSKPNVSKFNIAATVHLLFEAIGVSLGQED